MHIFLYIVSAVLIGMGLACIGMILWWGPNRVPVIKLGSEVRFRHRKFYVARIVDGSYETGDPAVVIDLAYSTRPFSPIPNPRAGRAPVPDHYWQVPQHWPADSDS